MKKTWLFACLLGSGLLLTAPAQASEALAKKNSCMNCHGISNKLVGPAFKDIAAKYKGQNVQAKLEEKVKKGGSGSFGTIPMSPNPQVPDAEVKQLVKWVLSQ